ncbi:MAG: START domain-containing protein [Cystobacterineae bacterium]|nr:START domain-containing protein [Cystobacterineae bacterium]
MRTTTFIFLCFIAGQALADEPRWEIATRTEGITVLARKAEGENIAEVKAIGLIQAPPEEVWKILMDFDNYTQTMPYTEVARRIAQESDGKTFYFYTVLNPPLVSRRDYVLKMRDVSAWENGKGFLKLSWAVAEDADQRVPPQPDKVRLKLSNGYWLLEPREGGKTTFATYYLLTDGGGTMPAWVMNKANKTAAPDVILAVRKAVKPPRK